MSEALFKEIGQAAEAAAEANSEAPEEEVEEVEAQESLFTNEAGVTSMETLCPMCGGKGITLLLPTMVPAFRELIIMSFSCEHCGEKNSEVTFGGEIAPQGVEYTLVVTAEDDLNRQVVKSDSTTIVLTHSHGSGLNFEIPPETQKGSISTIEGLVRRALEDLRMHQGARREQQPELAAALDGVLADLAMIAAGMTLPFTLVLSDPAGNTFVENPHLPKRDPNLRVRRYERTAKQDLDIGLQPTAAAREAGYIDEENEEHRPQVDRGVEGIETLLGVGGAEGTLGSEAFSGSREVIRFPQACPHCFADGEQLMCMTDIPHFKEIVIMAFDCEFCGYRTNEIKGGGAIPEKGKVITLRLLSEEDMRRECLKSDSAAIVIPEIDLEVTAGSLGGMYTTVEGVLQKIRQRLVEENPLMAGDSAVKVHENEEGGEDSKAAQPGGITHRRKQFDLFMDKLGKVVQGEMFPITLILKDALANSFIGLAAGCTDPKEDVQLVSEEYERSQEENDDFGISDMVVDDYEMPAQGERLGLRPQTVEDHPTLFYRGCEDDETAAEEAKARMAQSAAEKVAEAGADAKPQRPTSQEPS